jgi:thiamine-phosphate pyrophosphorylase
MAESCIFYYITGRAAFPGDERTRRLRLLDKIAEAASHGVDYIQLREKDMSARELESLAREAMCIIREIKPASGARHPASVLLVNSRTDVALASGADGVHLRSSDVYPEDVRAAWAANGGAGTFARGISPRAALTAVSCHSAKDVAQAAERGATLAVFGPVFEKQNTPGTAPTGLENLRQACGARIPVLALGGVTLQNANSCLQAGAAGIAGIRLFQEHDIGTIVHELRG